MDLKGSFCWRIVIFNTLSFSVHFDTVEILVFQNEASSTKVMQGNFDRRTFVFFGVNFFQRLLMNILNLDDFNLLSWCLSNLSLPSVNK